MVNNILYGNTGLGESRATEPTKGYYIGSKVYYFTDAEYEAYKPYMTLYNEAYGYGYKYNIRQPQWEDVLKYGQVVVDTYATGQVFDAQAYEMSLQAAAEAAAAQQAAQRAAEAEAAAKQAAAEKAAAEAAANEAAAAEAAARQQAAAAAAEAAKAEAEAHEEAAEAAAEAAAEIQENTPKTDTEAQRAAQQAAQQNQTPPNVVLPTRLPTVQPQEEKQGSGILIPAIILALGALAAIALTHSKPKRRR